MVLVVASDCWSQAEYQSKLQPWCTSSLSVFEGTLNPKPIGVWVCLSHGVGLLQIFRVSGLYIRGLGFRVSGFIIGA